MEHNLRGKFMTDSNGEYAFYCIRPTPYPVPFDGPAGKLLQLVSRVRYRSRGATSETHSEYPWFLFLSLETHRLTYLTFRWTVTHTGLATFT